MRLGIAGAGMIVRGLFSFIHEVEGIELEAIASTEKSIDKVRKLAKENHVKKAYLNYDELLNDEDIDVFIDNDNWSVLVNEEIAGTSIIEKVEGNKVNVYKKSIKILIK